MVNKRGQIALYVIIALVIVGAIALIYFFRPTIFQPALTAEQQQKLVTSQIQPIRDHITSCMKTVTRKSLNTMGRQGGSFLPKAERVSIPVAAMPSSAAVSYALFYDPSRGYVNQLPSVEELKAEYATAIILNLELVECLNDFKQFREIVNIDNPKNLSIDISQVDLGEKSGEIVIPFKYPIKVSKGNATTIVDNYEIKLPINLNRLRELSARIVNSIAEGKNYMEVIDEENQIQWSQLRDDSGAEKIFISAQPFNEVPSALSGVDYNDKNMLFKLEYQKSDTEDIYTFYVLVGLS